MMGTLSWNVILKLICGLSKTFCGKHLSNCSSFSRELHSFPSPLRPEMPSSRKQAALLGLFWLNLSSQRGWLNSLSKHNSEGQRGDIKALCMLATIHSCACGYTFEAEKWWVCARARVRACVHVCGDQPILNNYFPDLTWYSQMEKASLNILLFSFLCCKKLDFFLPSSCRTAPDLGVTAVRYSA